MPRKAATKIEDDMPAWAHRRWRQRLARALSEELCGVKDIDPNDPQSVLGALDAAYCKAWNINAEDIKKPPTWAAQRNTADCAKRQPRPCQTNTD
jgi:hypothetical protein